MKKTRTRFFSYTRPVAQIKLVDEKTTMTLRLDPVVLKAKSKSLFKSKTD